MDKIKILAVNGQLGYGFTDIAFQKGIEKEPDFIGVDGGSTDPGPAYLGSGNPLVDKTAVRRDLEKILESSIKMNIPLIIGSAGTAGADPHVDWTVDIFKEIVEENHYSCKLATIKTDINKEYLKRKLNNDQTKPLYKSMPNLSEDQIDESSYIVGQMGIDQFIKALRKDADVIIAGRATDTSIFAAYPILHGYDAGLSFHLAKIIECGAQCSNPGAGSDSMWAELYDNYFELTPLNPKRRCTTTSVAAHTMYEQRNPFIFYEPEGQADLSQATFEQINERTVRVSGSKFISSSIKTIKVEGSKKVGYRTIAISGIRDPLTADRINEITYLVKSEVKENFTSINQNNYSIKFRVYGRDGVMGKSEIYSETSHELCVIIDVVGKTQEIANSICAVTRSSLLHCSYSGRKTTGGNVAFPYSPSDIEVGEVYEFNIYHLIDIDSDNEIDKLFPVKIEEV